MAYLCALAFLTCIYLRPAEVIGGWQDFPFAAVAAALSVVTLTGSLVLRPRRFWDLPHDWFVVGFLFAIGLSNAAWGWASGAVEAVFTMAPAIFSYFLLRAAIESPRQLRWVGYTIVVLTLTQAANGIVQYHTGTGFGRIVPMDAASLAPESDNAGAATVQRIRGTGIFNDPNDLALTLVLAVPFLAGPMSRRNTSPVLKITAAVTLVPILVALYHTNSRGGMLGLAGALVPYAHRRWGRMVGSALAVAGLAMLILLGPSRMVALDASESSAQDRVQAWGEGLQMLKARPLFGVGFGRFTEFNEIVAHNSFVHTMSELGLFGSFFFVGMGYWFFRSTGLVSAAALSAWGADLRQSGVGLGICALFLSRQYNILVFVWLAMSAAYARFAEPSRERNEPRPLLHLARIGALTAAGVACTYVVVRVCGNWVS